MGIDYALAFWSSCLIYSQFPTFYGMGLELRGINQFLQTNGKFNIFTMTVLYSYRTGKPSSSFFSPRLFIYRAACVTTSLEWSNRRIYCTPTWNPSLVRNACKWQTWYGRWITVPQLDESDTPSDWCESSPSVPAERNWSQAIPRVK